MLALFRMLPGSPATRHPRKKSRLACAQEDKALWRWGVLALAQRRGRRDKKGEWDDEEAGTMKGRGEDWIRNGAKGARE